MDFSLPQLYIVAAANTLPTTGTTADLTPGQVGIFRPDYTPATAGNVAAAKYIYVAQGRTIDEPGVGTYRSDKIYTKNIIDWYSVTGQGNYTLQITELSNFSAKCGETVTISLRLFSNYILTGFANGLTRSKTIATPCCDCGGDFCADVDEQVLVDQFVAAINADNFLSQFVVAERIGTGPTSILRITEKPLTVYGTRCDPSAFPYEWDRLYFRTYAYHGPETSQDYNVYDVCDPFATVTVTQRSNLPIGTSDSIKQLEKNWFSYKTQYKHLFKWDIWNNGYQSMVVDGTVYDTYHVKFKSEDNLAWNNAHEQDNIVVFAVPTGTNTGLITILTTFNGAFTNETQTNPTTTTTTSTTSSTTSTTTTTLQP